MRISTLKQPFAVYVLVALAVLLPLLAPGHILTLDMALTPNLPTPNITASSYLFRMFLNVVNSVVPTEIIEKTLFFLILLLSGLGTHRLVQHIRPKNLSRIPSPGSKSPDSVQNTSLSRQRSPSYASSPNTDSDSKSGNFDLGERSWTGSGASESYDTWTPYIAGLLYMINPYTYSRFMAGQYSVLLGYALLPFFVRGLLVFLAKPGWKNVLKLVALITSISVISIHSIGLMAITVFFALVLFGWRYRNRPKHLRSMVRFGVMGLGIIVLLNSNWLLPLTLSTSDTAQVVNSFGSGDRQAFATVGDNTATQLINILHLQGFWVEARGLYRLPQSAIPAWGLVVLAIWVLVIMGGISLWRAGRRLEVALLYGSAVTAAFLATSAANQLNEWLPLFSGYREPHKLVGLVALCLALGAGTGGASVIGWTLKKSKHGIAHVQAMLFLLLPILFTPLMLRSFAGQLTPRHYPDEWFSANRQLNRDQQTFKVLFLPWHRYMYFDFAGRIIMNPAKDFFDKPVIVSTDPEFKNASPDRIDTDAAYLDKNVLPNAPTETDFGSRITPLNIKYIILVKDADFENYDWLNYQTDLTLVRETAKLKLYRNERYAE